MKISKLLVLSALWLAAGSAMATVVERQAPAPKATAFAEAFTEENPGSADNCYYLYNLTAARFFTQGNTWGTRACVGPYASAVKVYFTPSDAADGSYSISDYVCIRSTSYFWKGASAEAGSTGVYTDQSTNWGRPYWNVIVGNNNSFRLQNIAPLGEVAGFLGRDDAVAQDFGNAYSGFTDDNQRYPISEGLTQGVGHHIDWILVAEADYVDFASVAEAFNYEVYFKSQELLVAIEEGRAKNVDVTDEEAVYSNEASTIEDMDAAIAAIKEKIKHAIESAASVDNPQDVTSFIVNPTFDGNSYKGWIGSGFGGNGPKENAERFNMTFDTYQKIGGLSKGVYILGVNAFYRAGDAQPAYNNYKAQNEASRYAKLYAVSGTDTVTTSIVSPFTAGVTQSVGVGTESTATDSETGESFIIPNNMVAAEHWMHQLGYYKNQLLLALNVDTLTIGTFKKNTVNNDWAIFDDFSLSYLGDKPESYQYWVNTTKASLPTYELTHYDPDDPTSNGTLYTEAYLTAYEALRTAQTTPSTYEDASAEIKAINDAVAAIETNMELWVKLKGLVDDAKELTSTQNKFDESYWIAPEGAQDPESGLADWAEFEAGDIITDQLLTNEELETLINSLSSIIEEARKHPKEPGGDVSNLLKNPDFSTNDWTGWTKEAKSGGNVRVAESCAEAWNNAQFDIYQVVENAPMGVYEISVQGFYRYGRNNALADYEAQEVEYVKPGGSPCYVYMNAKATPFMNIFGETITDDNKADIYGSSTNYSDYVATDGTHYYTPNGMEGSAKCFAFTSTVDENSKMYTQRAYGLVAKEGDVMRVGVKGSSNQQGSGDGGGDSWVIFDNFKLTWWGFEKADVIKPILDEELDKAKEKAANPMSKDAYEHLAAAITAAETASAGTDGEAMFNALVALFDVDAEVTESVNAFKDLQAKLDELNEEMTMSKNATAKDEATALMDDISGKLDAHFYTNDDVAELVARIKAMIYKLRIPTYKEDEINDANPVDFTQVIENYDYAKGLVGWEYTIGEIDSEDNPNEPRFSDNDGNVELFACNYDYYQELTGLPEGIYRVGVTGFFRAGSAAEEWARKDSAEYSRAFLYAIGEEGKVNTKALHRLSEYPHESSEIESGYLAVDTLVVDEESEIFNYTLLANSMGAAADKFAQGLYGGDADTGIGNVVTVKVGADGKLRIGLKKDDLFSNDWTIWDDWELWFFGPNSTLEPSGEDTGIASISTDKAVRVEYFTIDGRKATAAQRGIIIQRMTMPNGTIIVNKIRK